MPNIGPLEIGIVLVIVLIVFGPKKLPDLGRSLGKSINEFKGSIGGDDSGDDKPAAVASASTPAPSATRAPSSREHQRI